MSSDPRGRGRPDASDASGTSLTPATPASAGDTADSGDTDETVDAVDAVEAERDALARARKAARDKGFRPGMKPTKRRLPPIQQSRSGAGADARDPSLLGDQLDRLLDERGWVADVTVGGVIGRWAEIVGPDIAAHVAPVTFDGTILAVKADSTAWATQMRLLTSQVLGRIDAEVGPGIVTELVVHGPAAPSWVKGKFRVKGRGPRDTYG